jgi:hypothetical protein
MPVHPAFPRLRLLFAAPALLLVGCSSTPGAAGAGGEPVGPGALSARAAKDVAPAPSSPKPGRLRGPSTVAPEGGVFDFGGGRRVIAREPATPEPDEALPAATPDDLAPEAAASRREPHALDAGESALDGADRRALAALDPTAVAAHGVRITWEALAVERDLILNPRLGRRPQQGVLPDSKIVLVSDDHPAARGKKRGCAAVREKDGSQVAVLAADDLRAIVKGLREAGFYEVAKPTDAIAPYFASEEARGRVTLEVDGTSRTLLSLRGQGSQAQTRDVPRIYSNAKQAVAAVRNQTPTLSVVTTGGQPGKPRPRLSREPNRTLTPEEAAKLLGEEAPAAPVDDAWGLGR